MAWQEEYEFWVNRKFKPEVDSWYCGLVAIKFNLKLKENLSLLNLV